MQWNSPQGWGRRVSAARCPTRRMCDAKTLICGVSSHHHPLDDASFQLLLLQLLLFFSLRDAAFQPLVLLLLLLPLLQLLPFRYLRDAAFQPLVLLVLPLLQLPSFPPLPFGADAAQLEWPLPLRHSL